MSAQEWRRLKGLETDTAPLFIAARGFNVAHACYGIIAFLFGLLVRLLFWLHILEEGIHESFSGPCW